MHAFDLLEESVCTEFPNIYFIGQSKNCRHKMSKPIVFNISDTQYDVVQRVGEEMGWKLQYGESKNWDLKWNDCAIIVDQLAKMSPHQKTNHFPGMSTLHRKNNLAKNLYRMQDLDPQSYNFFPRTFLLPTDHHKLRSYFQQLKRKNVTKAFIVKPEASCQGRGIFLTQDIYEIPEHQHCIVQKYISNPLLYKGLKFDFRVYVLIAGCQPLRIYIYNQGLVRFATQKYQHPTQQNMDDLYMHLTNYAINKDNPKYVFNQSLDNLSYGHKKSLAQFFQTLKLLGYKAHQYWSDIKDIIIKTMISGQPHLQHQYRMAQPNNISNDMCFQILGFDFIIDSSGKVFLLQINHTPSFSTDTPLDQLIKSNLIKDSLVLMNITPQHRDNIISDAKQIHQRRVFTGKTIKMTQDQRNIRIQQHQKIKQQYQKNNLGSFQRIYPSKIKSKQQKYLYLLQLSLNSYKQITFGNKYKKTPSKFRVVKRLNANQSYGQGQQKRGLFIQQHISKKLNNIRSQSIKHQPLQLQNMQGSAIMHLISKKSDFKTNNQQMTMFSIKNQSLQNIENTSISVDN